MKKYNRTFACPLPGGECVSIIAKSKNHMEKIFRKTSMIGTPDDFEDWGKLKDMSKEWNVPLKQIIQKSGLCYMDSYGKRFYYKLRETK